MNVRAVAATWVVLGLGITSVAGATDPVRLPIPAALEHGSRMTTPDVQVPSRVQVRPAMPRLGERFGVRVSLVVPRWGGVQWEPPRSSGAFSWGTPRIGRSKSSAGGTLTEPDTAWIELPLQVFATGRVSIPGLGFRVRGMTSNGREFRGRAPTAQVLILPTLTAADSNASLRPVRGPLVAPWWERLPWVWIVAMLALAAIVIAYVLWRRRRKPKPAVVAAPRPVASRRSAADEALAALAALRAQRLPERGAFGQHALELTRILRVFFEDTVGTPRPGDTSTELIDRLRGSNVPREDLAIFEGLLGFWDRVKFARAPMTVDEAGRAEAAVERLLRRPAPAREVA